MTVAGQRNGVYLQRACLVESCEYHTVKRGDAFQEQRDFSVA